MLRARSPASLMLIARPADGDGALTATLGFPLSALGWGVWQELPRREARPPALPAVAESRERGVVLPGPDHGDAASHVGGCGYCGWYRVRSLPASSALPVARRPPGS